MPILKIGRDQQTSCHMLGSESFGQHQHKCWHQNTSDMLGSAPLGRRYMSGPAYLILPNASFVGMNTTVWINILHPCKSRDQHTSVPEASNVGINTHVGLGIAHKCPSHMTGSARISNLRVNSNFHHMPSSTKHIPCLTITHPDDFIYLP
jgi:hypothetical protein